MSMQIKSSTAADGLLAAAMQNASVKPEEKAGSVEKIGKTWQGHSGVKTTGIEKSIGLYQGDTEKQDAAAKRAAEIKAKLEQLVNGASGLELFGVRQEGYSLNAADVEKIETVIDQIQVKLSAYCDSYQPSLPVDGELAKEILGDSVLAGKVTDKLSEYGVPVTEDNLRAAGEAVSMAQEIDAPDRNQAASLAAGGKEPSIENVYRAEHMPPQKNAENPLSDKDWEQLRAQAERILSDAGLEATEDNLDTSRWMIEQGIPLDASMLRAFHNILSIDGEMSTDEIVDTIAQAMAKGKEAREALLTGEAYTRERAEKALGAAREQAESETETEVGEGQVVAEADMQAAAQELTRYRRLEEIRLMMTAEAGLALLKKGIELETLSLSELVDALKQQEQEYYQALYSCDGLEASPEKLAELSDVSYTVDALKGMPSYVVGMMAANQRVQEVTAASTYAAGAPLKAMLDAAHEAYDALMTRPDSEYGDSMVKAFQNIDDILADMDRETTPENRRVIKILAYNEMDLTRRNMDRVAELDREYQYLLKNLTPRVTMHMIEKHINPLETEIHELNNQIEQIKEEIGPEKAETYSEFLWKLEKKTELSKEDRAAYIGMYRLLHQVDRTGEAAIGALANQDREVTLENLLSAVRTRRARGMDVSVDDEFGMLTDMIPKGTSISEQLKGFMETENSNSQGLMEEQRERLKELSKESETLKLLAQSEEPVSLDRLEAAHRLVFEEAAFLQSVRTIEKRQEKNPEKSTDKTLWECFEDREAMQEGFEELSKVSEAALEEALAEPENGRETIEELRLLHHTVMLAGRLASFEDYHMPVEVEGETCALHVRLVHKQGESGKAELALKLPDAGQVRAELSLSENSLSVFVMADSRQLLESVQWTAKDFAKAVTEKGYPEPQMSYSEGKELPPVPDTRTESTADTAKLYTVTKEFIETVIKGTR